MNYGLLSCSKVESECILEWSVWKLISWWSIVLGITSFNLIRQVLRFFSFRNEGGPDNNTATFSAEFSLKTFSLFVESCFSKNSGPTFFVFVLN